MSEANEKDTGEEQVEDVELQPETSTTAAAKEEEEEGGGVSMGKIHVTDAQVGGHFFSFQKRHVSIYKQTNKQTHKHSLDVVFFSF
jgi:hypothetical protein